MQDGAWSVVVHNRGLARDKTDADAEMVNGTRMRVRTHAGCA